MTDVLGRLLEGFICVVMIIIVPAMLIGLKMEKNIQIIVDDAATEFVDKSNSLGYISVDNYEHLLQELNNTGLLYDIEINHYSAKNYPAGNGQYTTKYVLKNNSYSDNGEEDIITTLYKNNNPAKRDGRYQMKNGDFLQIKVKNKTKSFGMKIYSFLTGLFSETASTISTSYGSYIGGIYTVG